MIADSGVRGEGSWGSEVQTHCGRRSCWRLSICLGKALTQAKETPAGDQACRLRRTPHGPNTKSKAGTRRFKTRPCNAARSTHEGADESAEGENRAGREPLENHGGQPGGWPACHHGRPPEEPRQQKTRGECRAGREPFTGRAPCAGGGPEGSSITLPRRSRRRARCRRCSIQSPDWRIG